jgi:hypothetical protein
MKRETKIEETLLIDAKRRQEKLKQKIDEKAKQDSTGEHKKLSNNSHKLVYQKFM